MDNGKAEPLTKQFKLGVVLSITTGRFLAENNFGEVYEILNWMTRDELFTHQLPRASQECKPVLLRRFPKLQEVEQSELWRELCDAADAGAQDAEWFKAWRVRAYAAFGEVFDVERIPLDDHRKINPLEELAGMVDPAKVIVVRPNETGGYDFGTLRKTPRPDGDGDAGQ